MQIKNTFRTITALLTAAVIAVSCSSRDASDLLGIDIDSYQPAAEFVPAYEAIKRQETLQQGRDYDLEQTVRVLNAMEIAQTRAENFEEFLDLMARQDYCGVAPDVLEAKRKLFPVLEYMFRLQQQDEQMGDGWMLMRSAARGGQTLIENTNISHIIRSGFGDVFALLGIAAGESAEKSVDEVFAQYESDKRLKASVQKDLDMLRATYRQYLEDYSAIYNKYMQEYDALCNLKDKAYLALYSGQTDEALKNSSAILRQYPDNGEAMLLQAMGLILLGGSEQETMLSAPPRETLLTDSTEAVPEGRLLNAHLQGASQLLGRYTSLFPDRTAPALVLEGLLNQQIGNEQKALVCFNQASAQYPRQAARLCDMLDSYNTRNYLTQTAEGQYLRRLYASTMEGYGLFSPNLLKARHFADQGRMDEARDEIFKHFFRRAGQGIYDELLSDMQFCEENLYAPFKSLLLEQSYLDVETSCPGWHWLPWSSYDKMEVTVSNHSDIDLENVRLLLCIHYTDMFSSEYDVVQAPSVSVLKKHSSFTLDPVTLDYPGKDYRDITRVRVIAITDDRVCWIDNAHQRENKVLAMLRGEQRTTSEQQQKARQEYLSSYSIEPSKLQKTLREGVTASLQRSGSESWWNRLLSWFGVGSSADVDGLLVEVPRVMVLTNPIFSIGPLDSNQVVRPRQNEIDGTAIRLAFDYQPSASDPTSLFIYTDEATYRIDIVCNDDAAQIVDVSIV